MISQLSEAQISKTIFLREGFPICHECLYTNEGVEKRKNEIIRWLSPIDPTINQAAARKKHEDQTGEWFTKGEEYRKWTKNTNSFLWLHGIPGCGKTILWSDLMLGILLETYANTTLALKLSKRHIYTAKAITLPTSSSPSRISKNKRLLIFCVPFLHSWFNKHW